MRICAWQKFHTLLLIFLSAKKAKKKPLSFAGEHMISRCGNLVNWLSVFVLIKFLKSCELTDSFCYDKISVCFIVLSFFLYSSPMIRTTAIACIIVLLHNWSSKCLIVDSSALWELGCLIRWWWSRAVCLVWWSRSTLEGFLSCFCLWIGRA
jgi:hypothetical protein